MWGARPRRYQSERTKLHLGGRVGEASAVPSLRRTINNRVVFGKALSGFQDVNFSLTEPAGDLRADVFVRKPESFFAVRTLSVGIGLQDVLTGGIEAKIGRAILALDSLAQVLAIDFQFLLALRACYKQADGCDFNQAIHLLKRNERRNFNAVDFQIWIEQLSAGPAMNEIRWHVFTTLRAETTRPRGHVSLPSRRML